MPEIDRIDDAIRNLGGCWAKLDDAAHDRYGMTYERAVRDARGGLAFYIRVLCDELNTPLPSQLRNADEEVTA